MYLAGKMRGVTLVYFLLILTRANAQYSAIKNQEPERRIINNFFDTDGIANGDYEFGFVSSDGTERKESGGQGWVSLRNSSGETARCVYISSSSSYNAWITHRPTSSNYFKCKQISKKLLKFYRESLFYVPASFIVAGQNWTIITCFTKNL
ncbi:hypothetical protein evm_009750 [Chilo suppressalis]|nr:hypothetical protein evm_009750 [Chilo suppressalis]